MNKLKRFALFLRVSSSGQQDGQSLTVQRKLGEEYIKRLKGKLEKVYEGVESATKSLNERKLLQQILRDAQDKKWDALWVLDQSRLTRSPETHALISTAFPILGLEVHTLNGLLQLDTPEGELQSGIQSQTDRYFAKKITQRTLQSRLELLEQGRHAFGRWPWGRIWNKQTDLWEIDEKKQSLIKKAYHLYVHKNLSLSEVSKKLSIPKSTLTKAFYSTGLTTWPIKLQTSKGLREFELKIPPLLSATESHAVTARKKRNLTVRPGTTKRRWMLQGMIRCWHCNSNLSGTPGTKDGGKEYLAYRHLPSKRGSKCLWHVPAPLIEDDVVHACAEVIRDDKKLTQAIKDSLDSSRENITVATERLEQIIKDEESMRRRLDRANEELLLLDGSEAACLRIRNEIRKISASINETDIEKRELQDQITAQKIPIGNAKEIAARLLSITGLSGNFSIIKLTKEQKRQLVMIVVNREKRDSPNGIYVKMIRGDGGRNDVSWDWELRGSLALVEGITSYMAERSSRPNVQRHLNLDAPAISKLAAFVKTLNPSEGLKQPLYKSSRSSSLRNQSHASDGVQSTTQWTSSDSHRCA